MNIRFFKAVKTTLPALLLLGGCAKDLSVDTPGTPGANGGDVAITVSIPGQQTPATRSIDGAGGEAKVTTIDVLVFKPGESGSPDVLAEHVVGESIQPDPGGGNNNYKVQFKARIAANASATTVVLVANMPDMTTLLSGAVGLGKPAVLARLQHASVHSGGTGGEGWKWKANNGNAPNGGVAPGTDYTPIPMYGERIVAPGGIKEGMKIDDVPLVRMLARIDVENNASGFTLSEVWVVNYNTAGYVAPKWNTQTGAILQSGQPGYPYDTNGVPMIPASPGTQTGQANAQKYTYTAGGLVGEIYTYEAVATTGAEGTAGHTDAACIVIKGRRSGDTQDQFYRIDFTAGTDGAGKLPGETGFNPATVKYMPLYRNHRYNVTITQISGPGYTSFDVALQSLGIRNNLKASLLVVDEGGITDIVFNNNYFLGIGGEAALGFSPGGEVKVPCTTNHASGWQVDTRFHAGGIEYTAGGTGWLKAEKDGAGGDPKANLKLTTLTAGGGVMREAWVHIKAGTLTHKVKVTQEYVTVRFAPTDLVLPSAAINAANNGSYAISVACTDSQGNDVPSVAWTLTSAASSWFTLSLTQAGPGAASVSGAGSQTVYVFASENTSTSTARTTTVYKGGTPSDVAVNITQAFTITGGGTVIPGNTYVGAFWRAEQTGERLIRIATPSGAHGAWSAQVYEYGDFAAGDIVFSTDPSADGNVWTASENVDMNNTTNDAAYSVAGNDAFVSGTTTAGGYIFFRIGLKSKWSSNPAYNADTKPARYAVVVISYNNNTKYQKLFLRQGHEADYLMRPGDPNSSGAAIADNRSYARKFTPYNLTAEGYRSETSSAASIQLNPRGGTFTNYPSQAGAFFQWANATNIRYAYNPTNPTGAVSGWQNNYPSTYWNTLGADHETCPPGYHRPTDGIITGNTAGNAASSEMRQSLWRNPQTSATNNLDNSVWGYYADGFFDRRQIVSSVGTNPTAATAVAVNTVNAAYIGRLFFNSDPASLNYNASLFVPAAGYRSYTDGQLFTAGSSGYYWSSSALSTTYGWSLNVYSGYAGQGGADRSFGLAVRCVRE